MTKHSRITALTIFALALALGRPALSQEQTRHLWDTAFLTPTTNAAKTHDNSAKKPHYTILTPKVSSLDVDPNTVVGITVWRLREHKDNDTGERLLTHDGSKNIELEPRRISARTPLKRGDKVRVTVEAAREGYLYVVDQERYADGKEGEPYLIFPVSTIRGGENHVTPGEIIELPAQDDDPPYLTISISRPDHVGERLTILISPTPLKDVEPKAKAQRLSREQYAAWERDSHISTGMAEMASNLDFSWSKEEKEAGRDPAATLQSAAPHPQTLFYSPQADAKAPTLVKLVLNYAPQGQR